MNDVIPMDVRYPDMLLILSLRIELTAATKKHETEIKINRWMK